MNLCLLKRHNGKKLLSYIEFWPDEGSYYMKVDHKMIRTFTFCRIIRICKERKGKLNYYARIQRNLKSRYENTSISLHTFCYFLVALLLLLLLFAPV